MRRKHKHKRKEMKLKNSDKLSAYILVTHALPFSAMLESNLEPKGSPATRLLQIFMLLRLRMSPYAYAYRTCTHPCAYAWSLKPGFTGGSTVYRYAWRQRVWFFEPFWSEIGYRF